MRPIKRWFRRIPFITSLSAVIVVSAPSPGVQAQPAPPADLQAVSPDALPLWANWYPLQYWNSYPPFPANWCAGRTDVAYYLSPSFGTNNILVDDPLAQVAQAGGASPMDQGPPPLPPPNGGTGNGGGSQGSPPQWSTGPGLLLEIFADTNHPGLAQIILYGATNTSLLYQLESKTNLISPAVGGWFAGQVLQGQPGTNGLWFTEIPTTNLSQNFVRALAAPCMAYLTLYQGNAVEPSSNGASDGVSGEFQVSLTQEASTNLTLYYTTSGTAINGIDYTNLPGSVTISNGQFGCPVWVAPLYRPPDFDTLATFTLVPTNGYVVNPSRAAVSISIRDNMSPTNLSIVATSILGPEDIDYYAPSNCLVIPVNYVYGDAYGLPCNFALLNTNNELTQWSSVTNVGDGYTEVKIATVKVSTNGFTAGQMFFGNCTPGGIGQVSADGTSAAIHWVTLQPETNDVEGDLYVDQTGIWSNNLLAVTASWYDPPNDLFGARNVWEIDASGHFRLIASINAIHLEGLLTLPNDTAKYGPWAGKLLTADEQTQTIYWVDTNGVVESSQFYGGAPSAAPVPIAADTFRLIPTNQPLYIVYYDPYHAGNGAVFKVETNFFTPYLGDVLAVQSGEAGESDFPALYVFHWNGSSFDIATVPMWFFFPPPESFEKAAFAPVDIPPLP